MGIALGIIAALFLGLSDTAAAKASRRVPAVTVTRTALFVSVFVAIAGFLFVPSVWTVRDSLFAAGSGTAMTIGLVMLYSGYAKAPVGIVAPISSVLTASIPVIVSLVKGDRPSPIVWAGMALGLAGIGFATYEPRVASTEPGSEHGSEHGSGTAAADRQAQTRFGLKLGLASGACFGVGFSMLAATSTKAGVTAVIVQRLAGLALLTALWVKQRLPYMTMTGEPRKFGVLTGLFAGIAMVCLKVGYTKASQGTVSVSASQYATFGALFAFLFVKERLRPIAVAGIACAAVGVALMSLG